MNISFNDYLLINHMLKRFNSKITRTPHAIITDSYFFNYTLKKVAYELYNISKKYNMSVKQTKKYYKLFNHDWYTFEDLKDFETLLNNTEHKLNARRSVFSNYSYDYLIEVALYQFRRDF